MRYKRDIEPLEMRAGSGKKAGTRQGRPRSRSSFSRESLSAGTANFTVTSAPSSPALLLTTGLLVNYPPKVAVSGLVNSLKGVSSRLLRKKNYTSIRKKLWGGALWSPSYFAGSCGGAPIEIIRQYIEQQRTPH